MDTQKQDLPKGWRWAKLGDITQVISGSTPNSSIQEYWNGDICWITPTDLGKLVGHDIHSSGRYITKAGYMNSGTEMVPAGAVVMSSRAPIGHLGIAQVALCTNQGCKSFVPKQELDSSFLYFALKHNVPAIQALGSGSTFAEVSKSQMAAFGLAYPPLAEQRRIAATLREHLAAVEAARAAAQARLAAAQAMPAALLREVFESEEAQGWERRPLGEVGLIGAGVTLGKKYEHVQTRSIPYLRVANVKDGYLDLSDMNEIAVPERDIEKCRLAYGDLLLTEGGDPDKLGRGTFWAGQIKECIHQNHIFRVRFDLQQYLPAFLSAQIGSAYGKAYFLSHAKQTTGIATINKQVLAGFPLMTPPHDVQISVMAKLDTYLAASESVSSATESQLTAIEAMPAALLRMAFAGEL